MPISITLIVFVTCYHAIIILFFSFYGKRSTHGYAYTFRLSLASLLVVLQQILLLPVPQHPLLSLVFCLLPQLTSRNLANLSAITSALLLLQSSSRDPSVTKWLSLVTCVLWPWWPRTQSVWCPTGRGQWRWPSRRVSHAPSRTCPRDLQWTLPSPTSPSPSKRAARTVSTDLIV